MLGAICGLWQGDALLLRPISALKTCKSAELCDTSCIATYGDEPTLKRTAHESASAVRGGAAPHC